jgi:hypothetical protein
LYRRMFDTRAHALAFLLASARWFFRSRHELIAKIGFNFLFSPISPIGCSEDYITVGFLYCAPRARARAPLDGVSPFARSRNGSRFPKQSSSMQHQRCQSGSELPFGVCISYADLFSRAESILSIAWFESIFIEFSAADERRIGASTDFTAFAKTAKCLFRRSLKVGCEDRWENVRI